MTEKGDHGNRPHSHGINMIQNRNDDNNLCKCMPLNAVLVKTLCHCSMNKESQLSCTGFVHNV